MTEEDFIRALVHRRSMLLAYLRSIVVSPDLSEDIFQEVVIVALKKRDQLEDLSGIGPWLRAIARFEALNSLRKLQRQPVLFDDHMLDLVDAGWSEFEDYNSKDYSSALLHCVEGLTPKMKRFLELRYKRGLSGKEISEELGRPLNTVYVSMSRIHGSLRECINRYFRRQASNG